MADLDFDIVEPRDTLRDRTRRMECAAMLAEWASVHFAEPARSAILHEIEYGIVRASPSVAWRTIEWYGRLARAAQMVSDSPEIRAELATESVE